MPLLRLVLSVAAALLLTACAMVSRDEVARVASPDGRVEAVLVETNGGATTSFGYEVLLLEKTNQQGERVASLYGAVRNASAYGVNLRWTDDRELHVEYLSARREKLERGTVKAAGREIRIALKPGVSDPSAPSGGMLYNLERKR